jgi:soluble lytic murein transglycosylase-like protein
MVSSYAAAARKQVIEGLLGGGGQDQNEFRGLAQSINNNTYSPYSSTGNNLAAALLSGLTTGFVSRLEKDRDSDILQSRLSLLKQLEDQDTERETKAQLALEAKKASEKREDLKLEARLKQNQLISEGGTIGRGTYDPDGNLTGFQTYVKPEPKAGKGGGGGLFSGLGGGIAPQAPMTLAAPEEDLYNPSSYSSPQEALMSGFQTVGTDPMAQASAPITPLAPAPRSGIYQSVIDKMRFAADQGIQEIGAAKLFVDSANHYEDKDNQVRKQLDEERAIADKIGTLKKTFQDIAINSGLEPDASGNLVPEDERAQFNQTGSWLNWLYSQGDKLGLTSRAERQLLTEQAFKEARGQIGPESKIEGNSPTAIEARELAQSLAGDLASTPERFLALKERAEGIIQNYDDRQRFAQLASSPGVDLPLEEALQMANSYAVAKKNAKEKGSSPPKLEDYFARQLKKKTGQDLPMSAVENMVDNVPKKKDVAFNPQDEEAQSSMFQPASYQGEEQPAAAPQEPQGDPIRKRFAQAIKQVESGGNAKAVSPKGARGSMQIMPATFEEVAREMGIENADPFDEATSDKMGEYFLNKQLDKYAQDPRLAFAAYNGGPGYIDKKLKAAQSKLPEGRVASWDDIKDTVGKEKKETFEYVDKVQKAFLRQGKKEMGFGEGASSAVQKFAHNVVPGGAYNAAVAKAKDLLDSSPDGTYETFREEQRLNDERFNEEMPLASTVSGFGGAIMNPLNATLLGGVVDGAARGYMDSEGTQKEAMLAALMGGGTNLAIPAALKGIGATAKGLTAAGGALYKAGANKVDDIIQSLKGSSNGMASRADTKNLQKIFGKEELDQALKSSADDGVALAYEGDDPFAAQLLRGKNVDPRQGRRIRENAKAAMNEGFNESKASLEKTLGSLDQAGPKVDELDSIVQNSRSKVNQEAEDLYKKVNYNDLTPESLAPYVDDKVLMGAVVENARHSGARLAIYGEEAEEGIQKLVSIIDDPKASPVDKMAAKKELLTGEAFRSARDAFSGRIKDGDSYVDAKTKKDVLQPRAAEIKEVISSLLPAEKAAREAYPSIKSNVEFLDAVKATFSDPLSKKAYRRVGEQILNQDLDTLKHLRSLADSTLSGKQIKTFEDGIKGAVMKSFSGLIDDIKDGVQDPDIARKLIKNKTTMDKMRALLPNDPNLEEMFNTISRTGKIARTNQLIKGGSPTTNKAAESKLVEGGKELIGGGIDAARGNPVGLLNRGLRIASKALPTRRLSDDAVDLLGTREGAERLSRRLSRTAERDKAYEAIFGGINDAIDYRSKDLGRGIAQESSNKRRAKSNKALRAKEGQRAMEEEKRRQKYLSSEQVVEPHYKRQPRDNQGRFKEA